ncbi:MAG TPA: DUF3108 domain-containing protein [Micropepsaceae bacterium]|nr:DUF3108 domain-containing protein [Micropepsaceae bacterium]
MKTTHYGAIGLLAAGLVYTAPALGVGGEGPADSAAPASTLDLGYDLFVGGISLGKVGMSARFQGGDYKAISTLETKGIVNAFWQAKIEASSNGLVSAGRVQPSLYDSFSQNRSAPRRHATMTFGPEGPKSLSSDPPYADSRYPVSDDQRKKTLDPLSAAVFLTSSANLTQEKPCDTSAPVFDGRRRYDVAFSYVRKIDVHMDNGLYSGPALVCEIHYKQIAGYQQSVIDQNKKFPKMYAWVVAAKSSADPKRTYLLPVRVWAETDYGIVVALASQVKLDGQALSHGS